MWKRWRRGGVILLASGALGFFVLLLLYRFEWSGFGPDSTTNIERDGMGKIIKIVEAKQSGKTLWDWLSLLGVPLSLAGLGFYFQQQQQKRSDEQAKLERK
jgi:hypothetical protein